MRQAQKVTIIIFNKKVFFSRTLSDTPHHLPGNHYSKHIFNNVR